MTQKGTHKPLNVDKVKKDSAELQQPRPTPINSRHMGSTVRQTRQDDVQTLERGWGFGGQWEGHR